VTLADGRSVVLARRTVSPHSNFLSATKKACIDKKTYPAATSGKRYQTTDSDIEP
jgi:hypothetical protein